ncbi:MAG TPA: hypothetical protein VGG39_02745 [Polyangiaceae bacterium]
MPDEGPYRDELAAARARIADLERRLADLGSQDARARRLAALVRERTHVDARLEVPGVWPRMVWLFVVFAGVGAVLLFRGDLVLGVFSLVAPVAMGVGATRFFAAETDAARRQRTLVEQEIAALERGERGA